MSQQDKKKKRPDWFSESEQNLLERNQAFKLRMKQPSIQNQNHLRETRRELLHQKRTAKVTGNIPMQANAKKPTS